MLGGSVWIWIKSNFFGSLGVKLILAPLGMPNWVGPSMNQNEFFVQTSTLPPRMHLKLTECRRYCMPFNKLRTKSHFELQVLCSLHNCDIVTTLEVLDELNGQSKFIWIVRSRFYLLEIQLCLFECMRWRCRSTKRSKYQVSKFHNDNWNRQMDFCRWLLLGGDGPVTTTWRLLCTIRAASELGGKRERFWASSGTYCREIVFFTSCNWWQNSNLEKADECIMRECKLHSVFLQGWWPRQCLVSVFFTLKCPVYYVLWCSVPYWLTKCFRS